MAKLIKAISAGDASINVNGYATTGNLLELKNDGLFVGSDDSKFDKVVGKQLSTADYTTAEKTKLAGIETGAQVNLIETVQVNGSALSVAGKTVNVDISGKADKVASATAGNIATLDANGNIVDSGVAFASDSDVQAMLTEVFGFGS